MIENFWIINKTGILLYHKNYIKLDIIDDLLAGFLSAIDSFVKESTKGEMKCIITEGKKFSYFYESDLDLIFIINTEEMDNNVLIRKLLKKIKNKFLEQHSADLVNFRGNTSVFDSFEKELETIIKSYVITIKCQTCNRLILDDYLSKKKDGSTFYFCCPFCKEIFLKNQEQVIN